MANITTTAVIQHNNTNVFCNSSDVAAMTISNITRDVVPNVVLLADIFS